MLVKNLMGLAKFLIPLSIASTVWAADISMPLSATNGVRTDYTPNNSIFAIGSNLYKSISGSLSKKDQETHVMTVIYALENKDNGEIARWYNEADDTAGRIKVVMTYPVQGGICRRLFTEVRIGSTVREYSEQGCKTMDSKFWNFSR